MSARLRSVRTPCHLLQIKCYYSECVGHQWVERSFSGLPQGRRPQILFSSGRKTRRKEFPASGLATP